MNLTDLIDTNQEYVSDYEGSDGFKTPESGWHLVEVVKSEVKNSNAGNPGLSHEYEIVDCPTGISKFLRNWFNLNHPNGDVERIAREQFHSARCAIGKPQLSKAEEFTGSRMMVKVKKVKATEKEVSNGWCNNDGFKAEVKGWKTVEGDTIPTMQKSSPVTQKQSQKESAPQFNWMKKQ